MTLNGRVWAPIGPSPMIGVQVDSSCNVIGNRSDNGLVSSIAISPSNPNIIYRGTQGGGLWLSKDGGTTWTPIFDRQLSLIVGEPNAIAIDPNNTDTVYVGTSARQTVPGTFTMQATSRFV